jgi:YgiT-type zinc finger domain-containing protein
MDKGHTTLPYDLGTEKPIVIRDVTALLCTQCGEVFVESSILKNAEELLKSVKKSGMTLGFLEFREAV